MVIGVILILILAGLASSFMEAGVWESKANVAYAQMSRALYLAEAGANLAIADIDAGGDGNLGTKDTPVPFGGGGYWTSAVDHGDGSYTITSTGDDSGRRKAVEVVLASKTAEIFSKALFGQQDLDMSGTVFMDSYDSELGTYASQAVNTHPVTGDTYANANGGAGSNGNVTVGGNVTVLGDATPGPGGSVAINDDAYVDGSTAPAEDVTVLAPVPYAPPIASAGDFSTNGNQTITAGVHRFDGFSVGAKGKLTFTGAVTLYVDNDFSVTGQAEIIVAPGASVTIYHNGASFNLSGGGLVNKTELPENFRVLSNANTVEFSGGSGYYGMVYAPNGDVIPSGTSDVYGSFVGNRILVSGTINFHYDEVLGRKNTFTFGTPDVVSWRKVVAQGD
jgi:hypothetical protein